MTQSPVLVWFRDDLRLADNPALCAAMNHQAPVIALYVLDEESPGIRPLGGAAKWWLHHSLKTLTSALAELNISLILRRGGASREVADFAVKTGASAVLWNRRYGGPERITDASIKKSLINLGLEAESFAANLLFEPWTVHTKASEPYSVFTPFWRACTSLPAPRLPLDAPNGLAEAIDLNDIPSVPLDDLGLLPGRPNWAAEFDAAWEPGEASAQRTLKEFLNNHVTTYASDREVPSLAGTSRLSPHLRWGEISPYQVWHAATQVQQRQAETSEGVQCFLKELGWREFAWHTLYHYPDLATRNWRTDFDNFPWPPLRRDLLTAWQVGRTGVPLVDAGMRELWRTGWMHNRIRMVTASFLTKNLLIDWRVGESWFWDTLVDADAASNPFNWQWVAGSGADAAPYFRIFSPAVQAKKFDPEEFYICVNIPEWGTSDYPEPVVNLSNTRVEALAAYQTIRKNGKVREQ
ncbi:MAG: deoxyribodipyrimidine photo-lyase [Scrofimicrobium sp.]